MTFAFLTRTFIANPGYLPSYLKTPLVQDKFAPLRLIRIYNVRFWQRNKIHSFDEI